MLSDFKVDFPLLLKLASQRPDFHLVFIGDERVGQRSVVLKQLGDLPNVHLLGWRAYYRLPDYFRGLDVGLLPLRANDYTRAVFPMKFFEYLAAGLPVVASPLPALEVYGELHRRTANDDAFIAGIEEVLADPARFILPPGHAALLENDWETQLAKMLALIDRPGASRS